MSTSILIIMAVFLCKSLTVISACFVSAYRQQTTECIPVVSVSDSAMFQCYALTVIAVSED